MQADGWKVRAVAGRCGPWGESALLLPPVRPSVMPQVWQAIGRAPVWNHPQQPTWICSQMTEIAL